MTRPAHTLKAGCADAVGIAAPLTGSVAERAELIAAMPQFAAHDARQSSIRTVVRGH